MSTYVEIPAANVMAAMGQRGTKDYGSASNPELVRLMIRTSDHSTEVDVVGTRRELATLRALLDEVLADPVYAVGG